MATQLTEENTVSTGNADRFRQTWYVVTQLVVLGVMALALFWTSHPPDPNTTIADLQRPDLTNWGETIRLYKIPLGLFAAASLLVAVIPAWRRSPIASWLGGITLATVCWLSSVHIWQLKLFTEADATIPLIAPVVFGVALLLALLGLFARAGIIRGTTSLGKGALAGMLLLAVACILCYGVINFLPALKSLNYEIAHDQFWEMLASVFLFGPALWLGGVAIRREARLVIQPLGTVLVLVVFFIMWSVR